MPRQKQSVEFAAEPRPWQRIPVRTGEAHDVVDGEEIGRVIKRLDKPQFMRDGFFDMRRNAIWIAKFCAFPREKFQSRLRRRKAFAQLLGVVAAQFIEAEAGAFEKAQRLPDRLRRVGEKARHLGAALDVPLGIGFKMQAHPVERLALANGSQHIEQGTPRGDMHQRVIDGEKRQAGPLGERDAAAKIAAHRLAVGHRRGEPDAAARGLAQAFERNHDVHFMISII